MHIYTRLINTGYTQKNGAVSKVNENFISHLTWAQRTPSAAATVQVSHALITVRQCVTQGAHIAGWGLTHEKLGPLPLLTVYVVPV
jgi:hypothetical protein